MAAGVSGQQETISAKVRLEKRATSKGQPGLANLPARAPALIPRHLKTVVTAALEMTQKRRIAT